MNKGKVLMASRALTIASLACIGAAYATLYTGKLLPKKYLLALAIALIVFSVLTLIFTFVKYELNTILIIFIVLVQLISIASGIYLIKTSSVTNKFFNDLNVPSGQLLIEYKALVIKNKNISINDKNVRVGIINKDVNNSLVTEAVKKQLATNNVESTDLANLTVALQDDKIDVIVLDKAHVLLLKENYKEFYESTQNFKTIYIKTNVNAKQKELDITKPFTVYISGIDTYGEISTVSRSDVNILAIINPITHKILLVNTPRDYYVQLHGTTGLRDKLTHAGIYGVDMSLSTMSDLYNIPIDYYVKINFSSLEKVVDVLGGVNVESDVAFSSYTYSYVKGNNELDSKQALEFARARYPFEDGDRTRGKNQQKVIEAILSKLSKPRTIINNRKILESLSGVFETNIPAETIKNLVSTQLGNLQQWKTESVSVDGTGSSEPTYSISNINLYVMEPDLNTVGVAQAKISTYLK
jgi:polyisoprenyl-teichoic acid--peptidoglycan teichoic acid transferase